MLTMNAVLSGLIDSAPREAVGHGQGHEASCTHASHE